MIHGVLNIYKEKGFTSHDVVAKLRGIMKQKKIGHTGTLDPDAEGVLPVCLGSATKLCDLMTEKEKCYEAVLQLGVITDTQDMTGKILKEQPVTVNKEQIIDAVLSFVGDYEQIPPMYSALKVNGKKLYEYAREGKEIERKPRLVTIHDINILNVDEETFQVRMTVRCSKGTYIRTLCQDIGETLGCGGCMASLLRREVGIFHVEDSLTLSQIENLVQTQRLTQALWTVEDMFLQYEAFIVLPEGDKLVYNGNAFPRSLVAREEPATQQTSAFSLASKHDGTMYRVFDSKGGFIGIYEWNGVRNQMEPVKMFLS